MAALWALFTWVADPFLFTGICRPRSIFYFGGKSLAVNYPSCPVENIERKNEVGLLQNTNSNARISFIC
jgi:hypothetical protein